MGYTNQGEEFFLKSMNVEQVFGIIERTDYFFLYNIQECMKESELENGVYLSALAEKMELSIPNVSKAVKNLETKGYVTWKLDDKKEKTYIVLTNKAIELGRDQRRKIVEAYEKITTNIRKEDMKVTMLTLSKIRNLLKDVQ
ncbi:MAG: MarR family transcriptional regulator [Lachnospiraceae bacterium]|nr:MarR family transcriptional regulator [Lachnospiraceae bacterium]